MQTLRVELTARGKILAEVKILRRIFLGDVLLHLLSVIVMMPLNDIIRIYTGGYNLNKSLVKINHLRYMKNSKLEAKNEKELKTL